MKTHGVILPEAWHRLALAGVTRLLLPIDLREQGFDTAQPAEGINGAWCRLGPKGFEWWGPRNADGRALLYQHGVICPYRPGDRLALRERCSEILEDSRTESTRVVYTDDVSDPTEFVWTPASRMPLRDCRCFYRVMDAEPVRITDLSDEVARECGFRHSVPGSSILRNPAEKLRSLWRSQRGRASDYWAWSVKVDREGK